MNAPAGFEIVGQRGFYRPVGRVSFEQAVEMVADAMKYARAQQLGSLLVNTHGLTGVTAPSIFARHALAVRWAESAGPNLPVAVVTRPELIDPDRIGLLMAQNRGVTANVFTAEQPALAWLEARHVSRDR